MASRSQQIQVCAFGWFGTQDLVGLCQSYRIVVGRQSKEGKPTVRDAPKLMDQGVLICALVGQRLLSAGEQLGQRIG